MPCEPAASPSSADRTALLAHPRTRLSRVDPSLSSSVRRRRALPARAAPLSAQPGVAAAASVRAAETAFVDSLLALMTVEEKLGQLTQYSGRWSVTGPTVPQGGEEEVARRPRRLVPQHHRRRADARRSQRIAVEESRLGIPLLFGHDVIHGFRTIFPMPLAEAASWNLALAEQAARIAAREASASGVHWTFAPMVDIARDARWGRIVEGSGEDPYLGSRFAEARVRGFQGTDLAADSTVLATAKHFAAYGAAEGGRDYNTTDMSERTLREVYLPPFHAAVDAGVATLMSAFNEIGGVPVHRQPPPHDGHPPRRMGLRRLRRRRLHGGVGADPPRRRRRQRGGRAHGRSKPAST